MKKFWLNFLLFILLAGCISHNREITAPENTSYPQKWHSSEAYQTGNIHYQKLPINEKKWWQNFHDPILNQIIDTIIQNNLDLKIANEHVKQAGFLAAQSKSSLFPELELTSDYDKSLTYSPAKTRTNNFSYGVAASWELDLFGVNRNAYLAKYYGKLRQEKLLNDTLISIIAESVSAYIDYRMNQQLKKISQTNYDIQNKIYKLTLAQKNKGVATELNVIQARSNLIALDAQIPLFDSAMAKAKLQLEQLSGHFPGKFDPLLKKTHPIPQFKKKILISTPITVIRNRPDIRAAEDNLKAKAALTDSAFNQYFPNINLAGALGQIANDFGTMREMWSFGASVTMPLINFNKIKSQVNYAKSSEREAMQHLEKNIIHALIEVEQNIIQLKNAEVKLSKMKKLTKENKKLLTIAQTQYQSHTVSFINVLDAERSLAKGDLDKIKSEAEVTKNTVSLIRSLAYH